MSDRFSATWWRQMLCRHHAHLTEHDVRLLYHCGIEPWACPECRWHGGTSTGQ